MKRLSIFLATMTVMGPAFAINMSGFQDAPITRLTADEIREYFSAVDKVLETTPDGMTVEWKAPTTRFVSKITPRKSFDHGTRKCRSATIESSSNDRFERGLYTFCRSATGEWEFKLPSQATNK